MKSKSWEPNKHHCNYINIKSFYQSYDALASDNVGQSHVSSSTFDQWEASFQRCSVQANFERQGHDRRKDCDIYVLCCYHLCWKFRAAQAGLADRTPHHHISVGLVEIVTDKCQCVSWAVIGQLSPVLLSHWSVQGHHNTLCMKKPVLDCDWSTGSRPTLSLVNYPWQNQSSHRVRDFMEWKGRRNYKLLY